MIPNTAPSFLMIVEFEFLDGHTASYALLDCASTVQKFIIETILTVSKCEAVFFLGSKGPNNPTLGNIRSGFLDKNEYLHGKRQGYKRTTFTNFQLNGGVNIQYDIIPEAFNRFVW